MDKRIVLACVVAVVCSILPCRGDGVSTTQLKKLGQVLLNINDRYVDKVDAESLVEAAIGGMLK